MNKSTVILYTLLSSLTCIPAAHAATWTNANGNGDWFDAGNWLEGVVPTSGKHVSTTDDYAVIGSDYTQGSFYASGMNVEVNSGGRISVGSGGDIATVGENAGNKSSLVINDGGRVELTLSESYPSKTRLKFYIGLNEGSEGVVTVNTGGSFYIGNGGLSETTHAGVLLIGQGGKGTLNVFGGDVDVRNAWLGASTANGYGEANVTAGAFKARTNLNIGNNYAALGVVNVSGTGLVQGMYVAIGNQGEATGIVNVSGNGTFTGTSRIRLGSETGSKGTLNVTDNARAGSSSIYVAYATATGEYSQGEGTINLDKEATLAVNSLYIGNGGTGTLNINSADAVIERYSGTGEVAIRSGTVAAANGIINFNHATGHQAFTHAIGVSTGNKLKVVQNGAGTTTLSGNSNYVNGTWLNRGKVIAAHDKALGNGTLYLKGGTFEMATGTMTLHTGAVDIETGTMVLANNQVDKVSLTDTFTMGGGSMSLDIFSLAALDYDQVLGAGGVLALSGGVINLSGFAGFEGTGDVGNQYDVFSGFAALGSEIVDGQGGVAINGYDKSRWTAKIATNGTLYFEAVTPIPEPASAALLGFALAGAAWRRRRG